MYNIVALTKDLLFFDKWLVEVIGGGTTGGERIKLGYSKHKEDEQEYGINDIDFGKDKERELS